MKKAAALLTIVVVVLLLLPRSPTFTEVAASSVLVMNSSGHGSGVVVGPSQVLTAKHVAQQPDIFVETADGVRHKILSNRTDIAILVVEGPLPTAVRTSATPLRPGDSIYGVGAPGCAEMAGSYLPGHVVQVGQEVDYGAGRVDPLVVTTIPAVSGVSGGPVMRDGRLVGVMVGGLGKYCLVVPWSSSD